MTNTELEKCPGCGVYLPKLVGPTHRYIGASAGCWAIFTALFNAGNPQMAPAPTNALLIDAYAVQHPGQPSPQAIQSVAVHLITLYGVLVKSVAVDNALWIRQRASREEKNRKQERFEWLIPPVFFDTITIADIVKEATAVARSRQATQYVNLIWSIWSQQYADVIASWYEKFVIEGRR